MTDFERGEGEAAFAELQAAGETAATAIDDAFARAGESLARSLGRAAADGKLTLDELASAALAVFETLARSGGRGGSGGGLGEAVTQALASFAGARAEGGWVSAGGGYLVGERGPEVFRPAASGTVEPVGPGGPVTVNVSVAGGTEGLLRSEAQLAQMLARAVSLGARRG
jgi:hypothetical protein